MPLLFNSILLCHLLLSSCLWFVFRYKTKQKEKDNCQTTHTPTQASGQSIAHIAAFYNCYKAFKGLVDYIETNQVFTPLHTYISSSLALPSFSLSLSLSLSQPI